MRREDAAAIRRLMARATIRPTSALLLSPSGDEQDLLKEVWGINPSTLEESQWDLNDPYPGHVRHDVIMVSNTLLCSPDPARWLGNMVKAARYLLVQDCIRARRTSHRELAVDTGDVMRFSVSHLGQEGVTDEGHTTFDMSTSGYRIMDTEVYHAEPGDTGWIKFVMLLDLNQHRIS